MKGMIDVAQVELLVHTYYGRPLKPGDIVEVAPGVAERWERNRIARVVGAQNEGAKENQTVAELKEIAEANGVDISGLTKKADIIAALQAAGVEV